MNERSANISIVVRGAKAAWWRRTLPALLILGAPLVMLPAVWGNPVSAGEDDLVYVYPLRKMVAQALRQGRWPMVNPLEATGTPLMADPQSAVLFPATWLFVFLPAKVAYRISIFLAFSVAGAGAYRYLRALRLVRPAAVFGAVAFMFCGFMVGHRVHLPMIQTAGFLPWGLWGIERTRREGLGALGILAVVFFLAIAAGHWAILTFMALGWAAYLLLRGRPMAKAITLTAIAALLAAVLAAPQIEATLSLFTQTTRQHIGYATVGENSFFPAAGVLALFPMLMGNTTPNFYPQRWWGVWHLWEMLGYVGLVTLALAGAAVWALYRRKPFAETSPRDETPALGGMVRVWTWIGLAAGVWALGYYLPTYRLVHAIPILGVVRCPGRMLLVVDFALVTLAAVAVHGILRAEPAFPRLERLRGNALSAAGRVLPVAMVAMLAIVMGVTWLMWFWPWSVSLPFAGGPKDAWAALRPNNPAVWVPLTLTVITVAVVQFWTARPRCRWPVVIVLLLVDLFFVAGFVDAPADASDAIDPERSPAATWLSENGPAQPYVVLGLNAHYRDRPGELLQPKVAQSLGIATLNSYGVWHSPAHAHLFGFDNYGRCREWAWLVRRNHLLSLYNVRYLVAAEREFRDVVESVRIRPPVVEGENLLTDAWQFDQARWTPDGTLHLQTPFLWRPSQARQELVIPQGGIYRIALDARGPDGGGANYLRAEIFAHRPGGSGTAAEEWGMTVIAERIGRDWRHFEWTMRLPQTLAGRCSFRVYTMSERPIEVRHVELLPSGWEVPVNLFDRLAEGEVVYRLVAELPSLLPGDEPVAVYENMLCPDPAITVAYQPMDAGAIEHLRWAGEDELAATDGVVTVPDVSLPVTGNPSRLLGWATVPGAVVLVVLWVSAFRGRRRGKPRG